MSFRLRRGTDSERQSVVFAEGELVYTTDTKELYVGDGSALGGIKITGSVEVSPIALTRNLDLNSFDITGSGDIDISGMITANSFFGNGAGLTHLPALDVNNGATYQISIMGADSSIIVNSDTSELQGDLTGSVKGDVLKGNDQILVDHITGTFYGKFVGDGKDITNAVIDGSDYNINIVGSDSTIIVDAVNNLITGEINSPAITTHEFSNVSTQRVALSNFLREEPSLLSYDENTEFSKHNHGVRVEGIDHTYWAMSFTENQHVILPRPNTISDFGKFLKIWSNGKVMINGARGLSGYDDLAKEPDSQLDIYGVMKLSPQSAAPATPVEGMIAVADRVTWDPASVGSGRSYPVYYDGAAWNKMI